MILNSPEVEMKINEKNLLLFATSATPVDREGWLEMRHEVGKGYQKRWFVLKGNLLFYYDKQGDNYPVGVIIMEGSTIELSEEDSFSFKIVFPCEGARPYYLCTDSQLSMEEWMKALACGTFEYLSIIVDDLERQLEEVEAEMEAEEQGTVSPIEELPEVPPRGQRHNPFNKVPNGESKTVHGSRHHKENARPDTPKKKTTFRYIHTSFGRKILADRTKWGVVVRQREEAKEKLLIQL